MSNKLARPLDPEFQAVYDQAEGKSQEAHEPEVLEKDGSPAVPEEDGFEAFKRLSAKQQQDNAHLPKAKMGSFDHFEQGVSNTIRLGWDWLTR